MIIIITSVYVISVDLVKAYDTVNRELLWQILAKCGIPNKVIHVLKKLYNNTTISLTIEQVESVFKSTCGVKQGDNLAPILFVIFLNAVPTTLKKMDFQKTRFSLVPKHESKQNKRQIQLNLLEK